MKLIGAGLPRTGTLTQKIALEMLGLGPTYHMVEVFADPDRIGLWEQALDGKPRWAKIFAGYDSTVDLPGCYFWEELIGVYPNARVLLSVRDPEQWERSVRQTVWAMRNSDSVVCLLSDAQAHVNPRWQAFLKMTDRLAWTERGIFASGHETPAQLIEGMERHNEAVRRVVPPGRLLVWNVTEGWEPLCEFLGIPVPDAPFPHVNEGEEFVNRVVDSSLQVLQEWRAQQESEVAVDH